MRVALGALCIATLMLTAGCGGSDQEGDAGVTDFAHEGVTISYPAGWARDAQGEQQGKADGIVLVAKGDSGVKGLPYVLTVLDQPKESQTVRGMGKLVSDTRPSDLRGQHVSDGPIDVVGTPEAWRVVTDYKARPKEGGDVTTLRWIDVVWLDGDRQLGVRLVGPRAKMDAPEIQRIVGSLKAG